MTQALCAPARCREVDPDLWYGHRADSIRAAKAICNRCEVKDACLEVAMSFPDEDQWGVWAALTAEARVNLRAANPGRWPVQAMPMELYSATREERYGRNTADGYANEPLPAPVPKHVPVDWSASSAEANAEALMDRYTTDTETGYALTDDGVTLYLVNDNEFAA